MGEREPEEPARPPKSVPSLMASLSQIWKDYETTRNVVAFFFLGLTNNFGYVIMLSAAHDLLHIIDDLSVKEVVENNFIRDCNELSTGAVLLANIIPSTVIKLIVPFLPLWIHLRIAIVVATTALGLILVGLAYNKAFIVAGICLVSFSQGLGESSLLSYTIFFKTKNVLMTWASGTGLAGLLGSFSYSLMIQMGMTPRLTIFVMLCMPVTMAINFWAVAEKPLHVQFEHDHADLKLIRHSERRRKKAETLKRIAAGEHLEPPKSQLVENFKSIPLLIRTYTVWYGLVYFFEYFINQGLFELIFVPNTFLDHAAQYRWYNTLYQAGVFVSRSSMNLVHINMVFLTALFQGVNVIVFLFEAIYGYITYLPLIFILIVWEGLLGGACYVNTFRLIATTWPQEGREFAMAANSIGDSVMVTLAGVIAIPVHDTLCRTNPTYGQPPYHTNSSTVNVTTSATTANFTLF
uniref:Battenin n=2 Tax=Lygus hesperus TaxID=30085 RepID=A0A0K8TFY8_LYGHE